MDYRVCYNAQTNENEIAYDEEKGYVFKHIPRWLNCNKWLTIAFSLSLVKLHYVLYNQNANKFYKEFVYKHLNEKSIAQQLQSFVVTL